MMKTILALMTAALVFAGHAAAQTLDDANRAFVAGKYPEATQAYEAVLAQKGYSAPVLFDLGNAYYQQGNLGQAILAYQRALWLAPGDADIAANLQLAQKQAGLAATAPHGADRIARVLSASGWAWLGCAAWTLLCASLLLRVVVPRQTTLFNFTAIASAFVLTTAFAGAVFASDALKQAVIVDKNVSAFIAPFPGAQIVFSPAPGETVTIQETHGDFLRVTDRSGHAGWISKGQVTPIVPS